MWAGLSAKTTPSALLLLHQNSMSGFGVVVFTADSLSVRDLTSTPSLNIFAVLVAASRLNVMRSPTTVWY